MTAVGASAQQILEKQAKDRVIRYLNTNGPLKARGLVVKSSSLKSARMETKSIYAFNVDGGGYVIASADSRALPVLGYSDSGFIDWKSMPDNMRAWLKSYDKAMETLGNTKEFVDGVCLRMKQNTRATKAAIEPLIKTKWNQKEPYWNKCPLYDGANPDWQGKPCVTGCVATAMAQVMNYHQWPQSDCKEIPAYDQETTFENEKIVWHLDSLPPVTFDWKNITDKYNNGSTKEQQEAVATLMRYCGQAVYMQYSPEFSGSDHQEVVEALVKYFGYDDNARAVKRIEYGIDEWEDLIYGELAEGRPVQYGGLTDDSGHSFICDGYDGNGFFHINWGWSGSFDGFFSLSVLNPHKTNTGSSEGLGFCMGQDAIIGVRPAPEGFIPQRVIPQAYLYEAQPINTFAADSAYFDYVFISYSYDKILVDFAFGTCEDDGTLTPIYKGDPADTIVYNYSVNYHEARIDSTHYEPGEYQILYPMVKFYSISGCDWQLLGSKEFHITAGRTPEGRFFLYRDVPQLKIKKVDVTNGLFRVSERSDINLTIHNIGEKESTVPLYLVPFYFGSVEVDDITDDTPYSQGEPMVSGAYLRGGMSDDVTFSYKPTGVGTVYMLLALADTTPLDYCFVEVVDSIGSSFEDNIEHLTTSPDIGHQVAAHYTDLQGRRLQGRPSRKGIFIRNRRKEVIK